KEEANSLLRYERERRWSKDISLTILLIRKRRGSRIEDRGSRIASSRVRRSSILYLRSSVLGPLFSYIVDYRKGGSLPLTHQNCHSRAGSISPSGRSNPTKTGSGMSETPNFSTTRS